MTLIALFTVACMLASGAAVEVAAAPVVFVQDDFNNVSFNGSFDASKWEQGGTFGVTPVQLDIGSFGCTQFMKLENRGHLRTVNEFDPTDATNVLL